MGNIKELVISFLKKNLPDMWFQRLWMFYIKYNPKYNKNRFRFAYKFSAKKNRKKYFVFRYVWPDMSICAACRNVISACEWAEKNKLIPVIDLEWCNIYEEGLLGTDNAWEYIFRQHSSVKQVMKENGVYVGAIDSKEYFVPLVSKEFDVLEPPLKFVEKNWRRYYKELSYYSSKWWQLKPDVLKRYTTTFSKLFHPDMKVLGVAMREEFSLPENDIIKKSILAQHPRHLSLDDMIDLIKQYKQKWKCTHIFVSTCIEDSIEKMKEEFGESLLFTDRKRILWDKYVSSKMKAFKYLEQHEKKDVVAWMKSEDEAAKTIYQFDKQTTIEYMEEIYGLSLCDCMLAGKSGGAFVSCVWNGGKYEELSILPDQHNSHLY